MKTMILLVLGLLALTSCRSYRGGTLEKEYEYGTQGDAGQVNPMPQAAPALDPA